MSGGRTPRLRAVTPAAPRTTAETVERGRATEGTDVDERDWLARQFDDSRPHLRSVAYSMLGSVSEAEDAVQESWLRLDRSDPAVIEDLRTWLTTVVARICLDMLRTRRARREQPWETWRPEPIVRRDEQSPEQQAVLADSVGLALMVVLENLNPRERLAFVLHDVFAMKYDEIAPVLGGSTAAARKLASRARRRVQDAPRPTGDLARQRRVVDAFLAAARAGDFQALLSVLHPDVVFRVDIAAAFPEPRPPFRGAPAVVRHVLRTAPRFASLARPVIVNGAAGAVFVAAGGPVGLIGFTVMGDRIAAIDLVADPDTLRRLDIST